MSDFSRKDFIKTAALLGGSAVLFSKVSSVFSAVQGKEGLSYPVGDYLLADVENIIYSVCLQCHTACPMKCKLIDGVLVKIDGPAYSPQNMLPHIPYDTPLDVAAKIDGKLCPKGQSGIQSLYDPYRLRKVLKRDGPRGSGKWKTINFDQAIKEIINGGKLFKHVKGEEKRGVTGLKDIYKLRDPSLAKELDEDSKALAKDEMSMEDFHLKHESHLSNLVNPEHPDLGPVNNQLVFLAGRIEHGRKELSKRWLKDSFGSINWFEHTTICEQSHHIAYEAMTDKYEEGKWSGGKTHMKPDSLNSEFIIFFGTGAFEANFGPTNMAEKITRSIVEDRLKIVVVDPRMSKTAARAWKWVPIEPGRDAALALGMTRWILENDRYDATYLANANKAAASEDGESTWTSATHLVKLDKKGIPTSLLRAKDVGLGSEHEFVVISDGSPRKVKHDDDSNPVNGDLYWEGDIKGIKVKTALTLLKEEAHSRTIAEWAEHCGIQESDIAELSKEFTSHGKKAVAELYRGPVQHTNGYYNAQALITLNLLIGNPDHTGGLSKGGGHWHEMGDKLDGPYNLKKKLHPGKTNSFGVPISREKKAYQKSTLFKKNGYPAKRLWFPFTSNVYQEVLTGAVDEYPYPIKAVILHMGTPGFSTPGANDQLAALRDLDKVPLLIACDIVVGESTLYADYVFPDTSIWERFGTPHITPDVNTKASKVRQPVVAPITERVKVFGQEMPISIEALMFAIAEKLNLPGHGPDGFGDGMPLEKPEDFFLKMFANLAAGDKEGEELPDADAKEMEIFKATRKHLPKFVFDLERWKSACGKKWWPKVVYLLNRGGRYEDFSKYEKSGEFVPHKFKSMFNIYIEKVAKGKNPISGNPFSGVGIYQEDVHCASGKPFKPTDEYPLQLITFKEIAGGQSRTPGNYWLLGLLRENPILINSATAQELGLKEGQKVRITSPTNKEGIWDLGHEKLPIEGKLLPTETIKPGAVAVSWHYGHWAYGAKDVVIDGETIKGDERRGSGLCINAVIDSDPELANGCLNDPIGGSSSFYDTRIKLVKQ